MNEDLIIGMAGGYSDEQLKPFVNSLKRTGYCGPYCLLRENPLPQHPIVSRFKLIADFLEVTKNRYVICVDTKDIVFQSNPIVWLEQYMGDHEIVVRGEGTVYRENSGNRKNMIEAFGPDAYEQISRYEVVNGGVIAGRSAVVKKLCGEIFDLCLTDQRLARFTPTYDDMLPDQSALNLRLWSYKTFITHAADAFVFHVSDQDNFKDGVMRVPGGEIPYCMFHYWVYSWWKDKVLERYRD